ncbi:MAG: hypothetical protein JXB38_06380 [Anaerolineales bacterium]|nr:hypothetical protein [Anaerolineales bacterium]
METNSKLGGIGAFLLALYFIVFILLIVFILPAQGFAIDQGSLYNPDEGLAFAAKSPMLRIFYLHYFLFVAGLAFVLPPIHKRLSTKFICCGRAAVVLGVMSTLLMFINITIGYLNLPLLVGLLTEYPLEAKATYMAITLAAGALVYGAFFTYGIWVWLTSYMALKAGEFPKVLNYLGLILGLVSIFSFVFTPLSFVVIILSIVWAAFLGVVLLRA